MAWGQVFTARSRHDLRSVRYDDMVGAGNVLGAPLSRNMEIAYRIGIAAAAKVIESERLAPMSTMLTRRWSRRPRLTTWTSEATSQAGGFWHSRRGSTLLGRSGRGV